MRTEKFNSPFQVCIIIRVATEINLKSITACFLFEIRVTKSHNRVFIELFQ